MKCAKKKKWSARVITVHDSIQKRNGNHNHGGDAAKIEAAKAMEKVKEHAINSQDTQHYIVSCASMKKVLLQRCSSLQYQI